MSMRKWYFIFSLLTISLIIVACTPETDYPTSKEPIDYIGNPTAEEILSNNKDADIILINGIVYRNAEDIEWVNDLELTKGEEVGEVKKQTREASAFENYTASKLPVGTKIYESKRDILIVIVHDREIRYLGLREG
jgi:hypothetical protein